MTPEMVARGYRLRWWLGAAATFVAGQALFLGLLGLCGWVAPWLATSAIALALLLALPALLLAPPLMQPPTPERLEAEWAALLGGATPTARGRGPGRVR